MLIDRTVVFIGFIKFGREVLDTAAANVKPGVSPDEIDRIVHEVRKIFMFSQFFVINIACLGLY